MPIMQYFMYAILFMAAAILIYRIGDILMDSFADKESIRARLIDKTSQTTGSSNSTTTSFTLTFEFENKERKSFTVRHKQYVKYVVGDEGILHYQRKRMNDFDI